MGPGGGVQEYCLRWNNHHSTLVSVMDALLQKGTLVDVTLAAEGKSIQVHRLVLCACSNYFQELLSQHWDKQAVVFLKDVKFDQLQALVDYMYRGEVNVSQDQLAAFLNTAEALKIKGLADGDRDRKNEKRILEKANRASSPSTVNRLAKRPRKVSKDGSMIQAPATATEKPQIPLLPSLVRIPHITSNDDSNDGGEESPESLDNDCHSNDNDMTENLHVELEDGEQFSMVEPKIEAEQEEAEYSGASGDEEDWSDSEYPSRMDASQGEQTWNDDGNQEGHMTPGNSHLDNSDANNSARGIVDTWHVPEAARTKSRKKVLPNQLGRYECQRCGRSYNLYGNLRRHWRYDCGEQPPQFACPRCGRLFRRRSNLRAHAVRSNCHPLTPVNI